jgi:tRNA threonylcarbamoyl adenosine modification protein (Sua5/YciO/YrdC/YwlC family)
MLLKIHPDNPQPRLIEKALKIYRAGGVVVLPTDTTYGLTCDIYSKPATNRLYQLKKLEPKKMLSILCSDLKQVSEYAIINTPAYRKFRRTLPGPYTFILNATGSLPNHFKGKTRRHVGIRVPDTAICQALLEKLAHPILVTSLLPEEEDSPVSINPVELHEKEKHFVDCVIDVGVMPHAQSTVIDFTESPPKIIREGKGDVSIFKKISSQ